MRKGSVQNTPSRASEAMDAFTASERFMGSSGGTTDAMIIEQLRSSFARDRFSSCHPACRGTLLIRNRQPVGPYSRTTPRLLWWS